MSPNEDKDVAASRDRDARSGHHTGHGDAVTQAEVHRIVHALRPYGVLRRDVLKREAAPGGWHEGSFEEALLAAVRSGKVEKLALDFYRLSDGPAPPPDSA